MAIKLYNPLNNSLVEFKEIRTLPKAVKATNSLGVLEIVLYYPEACKIFTSKGKTKLFGDKEYYVFSNETIESLVIIDSSEKVEKSIIKRAIVGGILTGGAGAIVGGMTGLKDSYKYFKQVIINEKFKFSFDEVEYEKIRDFFEAMYNTLIKKEEVEVQIKNDPLETLKKLKELLDIGAITQEEFEIKKKEILSRI